ncbi:MAG: hypothetical protein U9P36_07705 [Thermodesulfobacteriota bacterium]|nr:hypothetical protein [Thermodesulfobacteriota bacterium]
MAHVFSVEIHDYLSKRILLAEQAKKTAEQENDEESLRYYEGQLLELKNMRQYLTNNIDLKTQKYYTE